MDIKDFEKEQKKLLQDTEVANTWLKYQSQYPYVSAYYRSAEQYKNQISVVNGKKLVRILIFINYFWNSALIFYVISDFAALLYLQVFILI